MLCRAAAFGVVLYASAVKYVCCSGLYCSVWWRIALHCIVMCHIVLFGIAWYVAHVLLCICIVLSCMVWHCMGVQCIVLYAIVWPGDVLSCSVCHCACHCVLC